MARTTLKAGTIGYALPFSARDTTSTTGAGLSGLVFNTGGLVAEYRRQGQSTWTSIPLVSMALGTWVSGGVATDTGVAGDYEVGLPNAALIAGALWVRIRIYGAANMLVWETIIDLDLIDRQDAVRAGLTALPNAAAGANAGLPLGDASGRVDVGKVLGTAQTAGDLAALLAEIEGETDALLTGVIVTTNNDKTGYALAVAPPTAIQVRQEIDANSTKLDADVSSRLAASGYTAPDNADVVTALADVVTILARVSGAVALNSDMQTLLGRITGAVLLAASYVTPPTVGQIGLQITSDHGAGPYGPSGSGLYTWTINVNAIPAYVVIQDTNGTVLRRGTATAGSIVFDLDPGNYRALVSAGPAWAPIASPGYVPFTVGANGSTTIALTSQSITPPSSPSGCTLYGDEAVGGTPVVGRTVTITALGLPYVAGGYQQEGGLSGNVTTLTTDSSGHWSYPQGIQGSRYRVKIAEAGVDRYVVLPTSGSARLADLADS